MKAFARTHFRPNPGGSRLRGSGPAGVLLGMALMLYACAPDVFVLNELSPDALYCRILTQLDSVETLDGESFMVHSGGMAALRNWRLTQSEWEFYLAVEAGRGANLYLRTVPVEFELSPAVTFQFTTKGCYVEEKGRRLAQTDTIYAEAGQLSRIRIRNDGHLLKITVGCSVLYSGPSSLPATEFMVVEALEGARVRLQEFSYMESVPEDDLDVYYEVKTGSD